MSGLRPFIAANWLPSLICTGLLVTPAGCGDDGGNGSSSATTGGTDSTTITSTSSTSTTTSGTTGATTGATTGTTSGATTGATDSASGTTTGATDSGGGSTGAVTSGPKFDILSPDLAPQACSCSQDLHQVLDCQEQVLEACAGDQGCNPMTLACENACDVASANKQSVGCEYHAVFMEQQTKTDADACFAVFVANNWDTAANLVVEYDGQTLPIQNHAGIPQGNGLNLTWTPYNAGTGLPAGEVVALFLSGPGPASGASAPCPFNSAVPTGAMLKGTGKAKSFKISSDVPVTAYEMNPYGGGGAHTTGASLLLPTSAWGTNYIAANAYFGGPGTGPGKPQLNIIANEDNTFVTFFPVAAVTGGGGVPATNAGVATAFTLNAGEHAQIIQADALTGSVIESTKPVGVLGGHSCNFAPTSGCCCDHSEQMLPPVTALGDKFVSVMHRPRVSEPAIYHMVGAVDGTNLTYSTNVGGPTTIDRGEVVEFITSVPFVVQSQGDTHPFMTFILMSGGQWPLIDPSCAQETDEATCDGPTLPNCNYQNSTNTCIPVNKGDADFVYVVPAEQYSRRYTFFADPTYPDTNLVIVRTRQDGVFHDVNLDCLGGPITGWTAVGADHEWARFDLSSGDFVDNGNCSTGRREMTSEAPFGLWVWGWGDIVTNPDSKYVSYGYPAGMNVSPINGVYVPPQG